MRIDRTQLGGAVVRRMFSGNGRQYRPSDELSATDLRGFAPANLTALIENGYLQLIPAGNLQGPKTRIMRKANDGKYQVFEGVLITDANVTREEAEALVAAARN